MNLDKLITIAAGIVVAFSLTMNLDKIQTLIWRAQAKLIYESRTETWGRGLMKQSLNSHLI